jgi:hypothetical protein
MGSAQPPRGRRRQATPVTHARQPQPRRPRRRGWLAVVAVTLVLAAALVPRAFAYTGPGGLTSSFEAFDADTFQVETPAAPETVDTGDTNTVTAAPVQDSGDTSAEDLAAGGKEQPQQDPAPLVIDERDLARQQQGDQHDAEVTGGSGDPGKQPTAGHGQTDQAGQHQQPDANPGCGAVGSCSTEPPDSGTPTIAAAGGWWSRRAFNRALEALRLRSPQEPTQPPQEPAREEVQEPTQPTQESAQHASWIDVVLESVRSDPEHLRGLPDSELRAQLVDLDILALAIPADSPRAAQLAALREHVQAALAAQAAPGDQVSGFRGSNPGA